MNTATITIGRNIGKVPMNSYQWNEFQNEIRGLFRELFVDAEFLGIWEGSPELSRLFIGELTSPNIEYELAILAARYGQDAIGFVLNRRASSIVEAVELRKEG